MSLGNNIAKHRKQAGLSREKLAFKCGAVFSANHLWRVEKGLVKNPGIKMLKAIAKALKVKVDDLID